MTVWHSVILEEPTERRAPTNHWALSGTWDDWKCTFAEMRANINDVIVQPSPGTQAYFTGAYSWPS